MSKQLYIIVLGLLILTWVTACQNKVEGNPTPPIFSVTPVDMSGPYDVGTKTYGDILMEEPVLIPFGAVLTGNQKSPAIEYYTVPDAPVRAVCYGRVDAVLDNPVEQGDYEIHVTALPGSAYLIIYDHVLNVTVLEGELVNAGDTLGDAGTWTDTMRRTELQINTGTGSNERSYCPLNFGDSAFVADHIKLLNEYNIRGFSPRYDTLCLEDYVIP